MHYETINTTVREGPGIREKHELSQFDVSDLTKQLKIVSSTFVVNIEKFKEPGSNIKRLQIIVCRYDL